jgi:integrase
VGIQPLHKIEIQGLEPLHRILVVRVWTSCPSSPSAAWRPCASHWKTSAPIVQAGSRGPPRVALPWEPSRRRPIRPPIRSTRNDYRSIIGRQFCGVFGQHQLAEITAQHITDWKEQRLRVAGQNTVRHQLSLLTKFFRVAVELKLIPTSPMTDVRRPKKLPTTYRLLRHQDATRFFTAIRSRWARRLVEFCFHAGLRRAEGCRMQVHQVDLQRRLATWVQPKTGVTKELPLVGRALELVREALAGRSPEPEAPLFLSSRGRAFAPITLYQHVRAAQRRSGIRIHLHGLRHTAAMRLVDEGADLAHLGAFLGHKAPYHSTAIYIQHTSRAGMRALLEKRQQTHEKFTTGSGSGEENQDVTG